MYLYQYILMAGYTCLFFNTKTKEAATAFILGWSVYCVFVYGCGVAYYFALSAMIETAIAYSLNKRYRLVSYISYSLILVNMAGLIMELYGIKLVYDVVYAILAVAQFLLLLARMVLDGNDRANYKWFIVRCVNFDSRKTYATLHKNQSNEKPIK